MRRRDFLARIFAIAAARNIHPRQLVAPALGPLVDRAIERGWFVRETVSISIHSPQRIARVLQMTAGTADQESVTVRLRTEDGQLLWERACG